MLKSVSPTDPQDDETLNPQDDEEFDEGMPERSISDADMEQRIALRTQQKMDRRQGEALKQILSQYPINDALFAYANFDKTLSDLAQLDMTVSCESYSDDELQELHVKIETALESYLQATQISLESFADDLKHKRDYARSVSSSTTELMGLLATFTVVFGAIAALIGTVHLIQYLSWRGKIYGTAANFEHNFKVLKDSVEALEDLLKIRVPEKNEASDHFYQTLTNLKSKLVPLRIEYNTVQHTVTSQNPVETAEKAKFEYSHTTAEQFKHYLEEFKQELPKVKLTIDTYGKLLNELYLEVYSHTSYDPISKSVVVHTNLVPVRHHDATELYTDIGYYLVRRIKNANLEIKKYMTTHVKIFKQFVHEVKPIKKL